MVPDFCHHLHSLVVPGDVEERPESAVEPEAYPDHTRFHPGDARKDGRGRVTDLGGDVSAALARTAGSRPSINDPVRSILGALRQTRGPSG